MKKLLRKILDGLMWIVHNPKTQRWLQRQKCRAQWRCCASQLKHAGEDADVGANPRVYGGEYISVGDHFRAGIGLNLQAWDSYADEQFSPELTIGDDVVLTDYVQISCCNKVYIGNGVLMGQSVYISDNSHGKTDWEDLQLPPLERRLYSKGPVVIEDDVWIGRCATIMSGVHIGKGAVIGANSVVTKDVPDYCVAAGVPARIIKTAKPEDNQ